MKTYKLANLSLNSFKLLTLPFILLFQFINLSSSFSQSNLSYYIEKAYENNPAIKLSLNELNTNKLEKQLINSQMNAPFMTLTSNFLFAPYFNNGSAFSTPFASPNAIGYDEALSNGGLYSLLFNVQKNLFNSKISEAYQSVFDAGSNRTNYDILAAKHQIDYDVTTQYLQSRQQLMLLQINNEIRKIIEEELAIVKTFVENGQYKQTDYALLKMEAENQNINSQQMYSAYLSSLMLLNNLTGIADSSYKNLDSISLSVSEKKKESNFNAQYRLDSLKILAFQSAYETKYNPNLNVFFNTGLNAVEVNNIQRRFGLSAGLNFSLILSDGDQKSINKQKSDISLMNIDYNKSAFLVRKENQLNMAEKQIGLNRNLLTSFKIQITAYQNLLQALHRQLSSGQLSVIEYLTAVRNFLELRKAEAAAQINLQLAINEYNYWNW